MISSSFRHKTAIFVLAAALAVPMASAAEPRAGSQPSGTAWNLLDRAWAALLAIWSEAGCTLDPNGKCATADQTTDEGCTLDPSGKCATGASQFLIPGESPDNGCTLDPNGKCYSGS